MELWIRSQDKELLKKINNIEIDYLDFKKYSYVKDIESKGEYSIRGNGETLGQYKTKERALEVLDEIQNILLPKIIVKPGKPIGETCDGVIYREPDEVEIQEQSVVVYQMPKE